MKYLSILLILFAFGCAVKKEATQQSAQKETNLQQLKVWISTDYVECEAAEKCLQIIEGDEPSEELWQPFNGAILGFEGRSKNNHIYLLSLQELGKGDNGFMKYKLIEIIKEKPIQEEETPTKGEAVSIEGKWQLTSMANSKLSIPDGAHILLNTKFKSIAGNDGCNQLAGKIIALNVKEISFSPIATTKKYCKNTQKFSQAFTAQLSQVSNFNIKDNMLSLNNSSGETILTLVRK